MRAFPPHRDDVPDLKTRVLCGTCLHLMSECIVLYPSCFPADFLC